MHPEVLSQWMDQTIAGHAQNKAITFLRKGTSETTLTYGGLGGEVAAMAGRLDGWGVRPGDRVILFLSKSLDAVIAHLAVQKIGAVSIPLNPGFKAAEMDYLIHDAQPRLVFCDPGRSAWIREIAPDAAVRELPTLAPYRMRAEGADGGHPAGVSLSPADPALIIYTSGTTGHPKGAVLTQGNLAHDAASVIQAWEIDRNDVFCHALPLFHIHGLCFALHTALLSGAHVLMLDSFDADAVLDLLSRTGRGIGCTVFMAVPAMYTRIMDRLESRWPTGRPDFAHLRLLASGSAPLAPREFARIESLFGQAPVEREGMSETGMNFSNPLRGRRMPGSIGRPLPGVQVRIVDPQTLTDVAAGAVGELWLKSPAITPGYWGKPEETRQAFQDGWFRTGDLGRVDPQGYYAITDRIKHIIISGGENVSAREVEAAIDSLEGVLESAVVGIPDPVWGERVVAAVVARPGTAPGAADIRAACKRRLHDWKCPRDFRFVNALPRNTMGKVLKEEVKKLFDAA